MNELSYNGLDEALVPLHRHLVMLIPDAQEGDAGGEQTRMLVDEVEISMPIELDVVKEQDGRRSLGSSPPLYYVATGFESARHQMRVTLVEESALLPEPEGMA